MERLASVSDREEQSNSNRNEETQIGGLGINETHWTQAGQQRLGTEEMLLYLGYEELNAPHTQGVVLMLFNEARNVLIRWESNGPRIIKASFRTKKEGITMNIIRCYESTKKQ
ncbi:unnamed protein product [Schistosoma margrebowiei]|uniref:Uncharacterized protein n=1 Tax=Schistosoma margrebowiei TaxID=48269 RepID=A0A183L8H3_9TREM|nr:unnamed protein product [Schistosoma margrebowiei]